MLFSYGYGATTELTITKNADKLTTILIPMLLGQYGAMCIAQWSTSVASCKVTRSRHQAKAHAVFPWRPPWSMILNEPQKHQQNTTFT
jgi:hypothetical protein